MTRALTLLMLVACTPTPTASAEPQAPAAQVTVPAARVPTRVLDPPPPAGVVVPRGVRPIEVTAGEHGTSYLWTATLAGDPTDSELQARISAARVRGETLHVAEAALARYLEDVRAAGIETSTFAFMPGFDYDVTTATGVLSVFVRVPTNDPHGARDASDAAKHDDAGPFFEITVSPAGG